MKSEDNGDRLAAALVENDRLRSENERLRKLLRVCEVCPLVVSASKMETFSPASTPLAADEKIRLFRSLFRGYLRRALGGEKRKSRIFSRSYQEGLVCVES